MKTFAWLTATRRHTDSKGVETKMPARIEDYRKAKEDPPLPPLDDLTLFNWLMEAGPVEPAGMGQAPLSWRAIQAWHSGAGAFSTAWDRRMLRRLSSEYLTMSLAAENPGEPSPWGRPTKVDQDANLRQLMAVLG